MARARRSRHPVPLSAPDVADRVLAAPETSLLDVLDHVLNKGVLASGDLTLGVAGVDLVYVRLDALLCAADRVMPRPSQQPRRSAATARRNAARRRR